MALKRPGDAAISELIRSVDPDRMRAHVEALCRSGPRCDSNPDGVRSAMTYIAGTLEILGYRTESEPCTHSSIQTNLVAECRGTADPNSVIEIGAHYDTVPLSPGADDNGSGLAGLLEIALILRRAQCQRTIRLCFFGLEEESRLSGSRDHVIRLAERPDENHLGILVFEMIGCCRKEHNSQRTPLRIPVIFSPPDTGDFICLVSNFPSARIATRFEQAAHRFVPALGVYSLKRLGALLRDAARSDHVPYWRAKRLGLMITDTANFRNPNYHKPTDTPETLDYEFCANVTKATAATVLRWAEVERVVA